MGLKEISFKSIVAVIGTIATGWLGGWDDALKFLCAFMVVDYATGVLASIKNKKLNSEVMFWGGIRKGAILVVIAIAVMFDSLVGNTEPIFRTLAIYYYIAREGLSVVENLGTLGVPLPPFIKNTLEQLQQKGESK